VGIAIALMRADFPVGFLVLFAIVVVVGTILLFGVLVELQRESRKRAGRDSGKGKRAL
jgi:hypothetical protein